MDKEQFIPKHNMPNFEFGNTLINNNNRHENNNINYGSVISFCQQYANKENEINVKEPLISKLENCPSPYGARGFRKHTKILRLDNLPNLFGLFSRIKIINL